MSATGRVRWDGDRACRTRTGSPKAAFASRRAAEKAIPAQSRGLRAYACAAHGWHLGHG